MKKDQKKGGSGGSWGVHYPQPGFQNGNLGLTVTKHETSILVLQCPFPVKPSRRKFTILDMAVNKI